MTESTTSSVRKSLSPMWRVAGLLLLVGAMVGAALIGQYLHGGRQLVAPPPPAGTLEATLCVILGMFFVFVAGVLYLLALLSNGLTFVEDDLGMMWFDEDRLVYFGDQGPWSIPRDRLIEIERVAIKRDTASYFGAVHVILHFVGGDDAEHRIRLHTEGNWTQTARAHALDDLADRLQSWKAGGGRSCPPAEGFPVVGALEEYSSP